MFNMNKESFGLDCDYSSIIIQLINKIRNAF